MKEQFLAFFGFASKAAPGAVIEVTATSVTLPKDVVAKMDAEITQLNALQGELDTATTAKTDAEAKVTSLTTDLEASKASLKAEQDKVTAANEKVAELQAVIDEYGDKPGAKSTKAKTNADPNTPETGAFKVDLSDEHNQNALRVLNRQ